MREVDDANSCSTDAAVLADGLRLANHFYPIALGVRHSTIAASAAWLISNSANHISSDPVLNPNGLASIDIARRLLAIVGAQITTISQLSTADCDEIERLLWKREMAAPPGFNVAREDKAGSVPTFTDQNQSRSAGG